MCLFSRCTCWLHMYKQVVSSEISWSKILEDKYFWRHHLFLRLDKYLWKPRKFLSLKISRPTLVNHWSGYLLDFWHDFLGGHQFWASIVRAGVCERGGVVERLGGRVEWEVVANTQDTVRSSQLWCHTILHKRHTTMPRRHHSGQGNNNSRLLPLNGTLYMHHWLSHKFTDTTMCPPKKQTS